jgi:hypothetical protein
MKKHIILCFILFVLLFQVVSVTAQYADEAKEDWVEAKEASLDANLAYQEADKAYKEDSTPENDEAAIEAGKTFLHAALDEVEAWLIWKNVETEENEDVPEELKEEIASDVAKNLEKLDGLRAEVDDIDNRLELTITWLKMIGEYINLLTDVARNSGNVWVHVANTYADTLEEYELTLREKAEGQLNNEEILIELDIVLDDLENAREDIQSAEDSYDQVILPGTPLTKFSEGNSYLNLARTDLLSAFAHLQKAFVMISFGGA